MKQYPRWLEWSCWLSGLFFTLNGLLLPVRGDQNFMILVLGFILLSLSVVLRRRRFLLGLRAAPLDTAVASARGLSNKNKVYGGWLNGCWLWLNSHFVRSAAWDAAVAWFLLAWMVLMMIVVIWFLDAVLR